MRFLCYFVHRHLDFRLPEFESLAKLAGYDEPLQWSKPPGTHSVDTPFYFVDLPSEEIVREITQRSVLLKGTFEIWGDGSTLEEVQAAVERYPEERKACHLAEDKTFRIVVDRFGHALSMAEQRERIQQLDYIPFKGRVSLKAPECSFWVIESLTLRDNNGLPPPTDPWMCFARQVAAADRSAVTKYQLPKRMYLGPTAMDAEMALLMANQALARRGMLAYDPFAGTGSILVGAAHYGALTLGADIDIRVVRDGKGPDCNVWSNFRQYDLPKPVGLMRADNNSPPFREDLREIVDAVICDPPYGVRAGGRKSGGRKLLNGAVDYVIPEELRENHIPSTAPYTLSECLFDLLDMAARLLVMGGRLVYFYPAAREEYKDEDLPSHPCFKLVANSEQILTKRWSRRLLTMEKNAPYTEEICKEAKAKHAEFRANHRKLLEECRQIRDVVFSPADVAADIHRTASISGPNGGKEGELEVAHRPRYRAKCV